MCVRAHTHACMCICVCIMHAYAPVCEGAHAHVCRSEVNARCPLQSLHPIFRYHFSLSRGAHLARMAGECDVGFLSVC